MNRRAVPPIYFAALLAPLIAKTSKSALASTGRSKNSTELSRGSAQRLSSAAPSDADLFHSRTFVEPLVPIGGKPSPQENLALKGAINAYKDRRDQDDQSAILAFLDQFPNSVWRPALLTNLG